MPKGKFLSEETYNTIKKILNSGLSQNKISSIMSVSPAIVSRVVHSEDFEMYKKMTRERNQLLAQRIKERNTVKIEVKDFYEETLIDKVVNRLRKKFILNEKTN